MVSYDHDVCHDLFFARVELVSLGQWQPLAVSLHCFQLQVFALVAFCQQKFAVQMSAMYAVHRECYLPGHLQCLGLA